MDIDFGQDEDAAKLLDRLLKGHARRLDEVQDEFTAAGILGCREHIRLYGAAVTRTEIMDSRWVYKDYQQIHRLKAEIKSMNVVSDLIVEYAGKEVPYGHPVFKTHPVRQEKHKRGIIDKLLREQGFYFLGGKWKSKTYYGGAVLAPINNKELFIEDQQWMLNELLWMVEENAWELGELDSNEIWDSYGDILGIRVTFEQLDLWVRIINGEESIEMFLRVDSEYGY